MQLGVSETILVLVGGFVAGIVNGTVGGGSLLTYPLLVANGLSPVIAAATNTTGLSPGNLAALIPHRKGDSVRLVLWWQHAAAVAIGALTGGSLLILLPDKVFEFVVPILLVFAALATLRPARPVDRAPRQQSKTLSSLLGSGVYQGYFGPGQGVLAMAILLRDGRLTVHQAVVVKNLVIAAGNVVVSILFIWSGHVVWPAALLLMASVSLGGWTGARLSPLVKPDLLRFAVAMVGIVSAIWFVIGR